LGVRTQYFHIFTLKTPQKTILGTYNGKPMGNTYSHNCMMHRDTMLKFGTLFYLAKYMYLEHTQKFQRTGYGRGVVAPTLNFRTPSLSLKLVEPTLTAIPILIRSGRVYSAARSTAGPSAFYSDHGRAVSAQTRFAQQSVAASQFGHRIGANHCSPALLTSWKTTERFC